MRQRLEGGGELHRNRTVQIEAEDDRGDLVRRTRLPANRVERLLRAVVVMLDDLVGAMAVVEEDTPVRR
ncbi:MAG: hypothetical protein ABSA52_19065 [Candidatus Binatia bacterium]|jgi:hypothetical protein